MFRKFAVFTLLAIAALSIMPKARPTLAQTDTITLNGTAKVIQADIVASNGVIHVIDSVLIPPSSGPVGASPTAVATISRGRGGNEGGEGGGEGGDEGGGRLLGTVGPSVADVIAGNPDLSTLTAALKATGLTTVLTNQQGIYTVFAPTNEAFSAFLKAKNLTVDSLLADKATLTQILTYHVVDKVLLGTDLAALTSVTTLNGATIAVSMNTAAPSGAMTAAPTANGAS